MARILRILIVALFLTLASGSGLMAQFKFGGKASASVNNMFLAQDTITYMRRLPAFGYNVGLMAEYFINKKMSVGAEVMFARQGYRRTWTEHFDHPLTVPDNEKATCRTYHLNIPIIYRYYFDNIAFEVGPQISLCFGGKWAYTLEQTIHADEIATFDTVYHFSDWEEQTEKGKNIDGFNAWNRISIGITGGVSFNLENGLFLGIRYTYDFTHSFNEAVLVEPTPVEKWEQATFKSHHSVLSFSVGIKI